MIDYTQLISNYKALNLQVVVACDPLVLVKLKSPAEMGLIVQWELRRDLVFH